MNETDLRMIETMLKKQERLKNGYYVCGLGIKKEAHYLT